MSKTLSSVLLGASLLFLPAAAPEASEPIRIGLLPGSAIAWELDVIRHNGLDAKYGISIEAVPQDNVDAARRSLATSAVDIISGDWFWVSRQRAADTYYVHVPFLTAAGAAMAAPGVEPGRLADIGAIDSELGDGTLARQWLLIRALRNSDTGSSNPEELALSRNGNVKLVDWQAAARLEVDGYRRIVATDDAASFLGAEGRMPEIGYVFHEEWPRRNRQEAIGFVRASREAKRILKDSDAEWDRIRPLMDAGDDRVFELLKTRFREGIPTRTISDELADAEDIHIVLGPLAARAGADLRAAISPGTFWRGHPDNP